MDSPVEAGAAPTKPFRRTELFPGLVVTLAVVLIDNNYFYLFEVLFG